MFYFFRRIRKALFGDGATSKYLFYAIGEIALVVIGILIALQINNWNEWRKDRVTEKKVLKDLTDNLERNIVTINRSMLGNERRIYSANLILNILERNLPYSDTLNEYFFSGLIVGQVGGFPAKDGYEAFKNNGFDKVLNDSLKKRIVYLFEESYKTLETWGSYQNSYAPNGNEIWNKYFIRVSSSSLVPLDYSNLLRSSEIYNTIQFTRTFNNTFLTRLQQSLDETKLVLQLINKELRETE